MRRARINGIAVLILGISMMFAGCTQTSNIEMESSAAIEETTQEVMKEATQEEKLSIVVTTFPVYDWAREIIGDNSEMFELSLLVDSGVDMHSYQPTTEDIAKVSNADLFIYNGGDSDVWVEAVLEQKMNNNMIVLNMMEKLKPQLKSEEVVEGMEAHDHAAHGHEEEHNHEEEEHAHEEEHNHNHEEEEHGHEEEHHHDHGEGEVYDEHIWLSLNNAMLMCEEILNAIQELEPSNATMYDTNTKSYIEELQALDATYETTLANAQMDTILVADRFPFRYLVDDYDISYYAAFVGCSAETEASFETIAFLAEKINELQLDEVIIIDGQNDSIANTVIQNSEKKDAKILTMDSLQAISKGQIDDGITYLTVMEANLEALVGALD